MAFELCVNWTILHVDFQPQKRRKAALKVIRAKGSMLPFWLRETYRSCCCCTSSLGYLICTFPYLNIEVKRYQIPLFGCHGTFRNVFTPYSSLPPSRSLRLSPLSHSLSPPLAEINRRYLTLMWEHYVSCSVETTFVSATGLFALGNCAPLSCKAAWRYSCCREGSEVSGRGATRATWKYKECVVPVCDTFSGPYD